jgi:hypothetical protein
VLKESCYKEGVTRERVLQKRCYKKACGTVGVLPERCYWPRSPASVPRKKKIINTVD